MKHKVSCLKQKERAEEYERQWPNHCRKCHGSGEVSWQENQSPLGSGYYWPQTFTEFCDECVEHNVCPRCGGSFPANMGLEDLCNDDTWRERKYCSHCNWNFNSASAPIWECYCWENWED